MRRRAGQAEAAEEAAAPVDHRLGAFFQRTVVLRQQRLEAQLGIGQLGFALPGQPVQQGKVVRGGLACFPVELQRGQHGGAAQRAAAGQVAAQRAMQFAGLGTQAQAPDQRVDIVVAHKSGCRHGGAPAGNGRQFNAAAGPAAAPAADGLISTGVLL